MAPREQVRVEAAPEKRFFIEMITKDIELLPAIADLVDNSIDGARSLRPNGDFAGLHIRIVIDSEHFVIDDNCGGIDPGTAAHHAFRFGRPEDFRGVESSVGQFGIGMKRALFKLGDYALIESTHAISKYQIEIDVPRWAQDNNPDWSFAMEVLDRKQRRAEATGTKITVTRLHPGVREDLGNREVIARLANQLSLQHESALAGGIEIKVNARRLNPNTPALLSSRLVKPINYALRLPVDNTSGREVEARVVAGIAEPKEREERSESNDGEYFTDPPDAGWYIFCNDRLVQAADRSALTGWGSAAAAYHPQYRRFRGYVYLSARDSELLPWNTTKTGLDQDSRVFRAIQQEMFKVLTQVQSILNRLKSEVQTREPHDRPLENALKLARPHPVGKLPASSQYVAPLPPPRRPTPNSEINVIFKADRALINQIMAFTGLPSAAEVGRMALDYYVRNEVD